MRAKKVKFDGNGGNGANGVAANGNGIGGEFERSNFQAVRERPNLEEFVNKEEEMEVRFSQKQSATGAYAQFKTKKTRTTDIYYRQRWLKDKYRENVKRKMIEEERQEKVKLIKQGGAQELMVHNSFEKQAQQIQFIEHMSKYYKNSRLKEQDKSKSEENDELD